MLMCTTSASVAFPSATAPIMRSAMRPRPAGARLPGHRWGFECRTPRGASAFPGERVHRVRAGSPRDRLLRKRRYRARWSRRRSRRARPAGSGRSAAASIETRAARPGTGPGSRPARHRSGQRAPSSPNCLPAPARRYGRRRHAAPARSARLEDDDGLLAACAAQHLEQPPPVACAFEVQADHRGIRRFKKILDEELDSQTSAQLPAVTSPLNLSPRCWPRRMISMPRPPL